MLEPHLIPLLFSHEILKKQKTVIKYFSRRKPICNKTQQIVKKGIEYFINESRNERNSTIEKCSCIPGIQESKYIRTHLQSPIVWCLKFSNHLLSIQESLNKHVFDILTNSENNSTSIQNQKECCYRSNL